MRPSDQALTAAIAPPDGTESRTMVPLDPDAVLVQRLRLGDDDAYEELVRTHGGRMLSVARRMLKNEEDARDAVQQAFLSAYRAFGAFNGASRLSTWLHRIVVNTSLMKLRTRSRRSEESIEDLLPRFLEDGHHAAQFSDWGNSIDTGLIQRETRERVRAAIDTLPESYRVVLILRDIEELDTETTARSLGLTANAVKIRLHRARQALARVLEPMFATTPTGGREIRS